MSKSKLKPEDIFFGLQKTLADDTPEPEVIVESVPEAIAEAEPEPETSVGEGSAPEPEAAAAPAKRRGRPRGTTNAASGKRGRPANPDLDRRATVSLRMSPETKFEVQQVVNTMKLRGLVGTYSMTDYINEAIEEKVKRDKKKLDIG